MSAAERWMAQLEAWRIPDAILEGAPEPPWAFPPALFAADQAPSGALHRVARETLGGGGTVLDVGCGAGAASVPLVPAARALTGVDPSPAMLAEFTRAARSVGAEAVAVTGEWPEMAAAVATADVVVCRNVVYNVAAVVPFVAALADHARRRVVLELSGEHPSVPLVGLWKHFWDLDRPAGPNAELFVALLAEMGIHPTVETESRPPMKARLDPAQHVAFLRRRLCLTADRDEDIAALLGAGAADQPTTAVTVHWTP
ncbi:MAG: class I SAM-dependent methyltransferase [Acidobacteriota bacterium]|nr:class I SAM-dependent methyltransferase [Acidobacteriota bacterium]